MGSYDGTIPVLAATFFTTVGGPPTPPAMFPEFHLDALNFVVAFDGTTGLFGPSLLPPGGMSFLYQVPIGLAGSSVVIQAVAVAPSTNLGNMFFTITNGHEIQIL